jgi:restriction endonuclease S subunit
MKKNISLADVKYFELFIGKRILKEEVFHSKGIIPVYSGSVSEPFGFLDKSDISDFEHNYIIWGIDDAVFDFAIINKGTKFAITDHCGAIKILDNKILPEYLLYELKSKKSILGFGWTLRASLTNMKKEVSVSIPIKSDGSFDEDKQLELIHKYTFIKEINQYVKFQIEELKDAIVEIGDEEKDTNFKTVKLCQILDFPETNSGMTKELCQQNKGNIPVYGCSKSEASVLGYIKEGMEGIKYYEDCLTWNRNGSVIAYHFN